MNESATTTPSPTTTREHAPGPIGRALSAAIVGLVYAYRYTLGPILGGRCRFQPTCSQYMLDAVRKHGPWRGGWRGVKRICRCHPYSEGGHDPA